MIWWTWVQALAILTLFTSFDGAFASSKCEETLSLREKIRNTWILFKPRLGLASAQPDDRFSVRIVSKSLDGSAVRASEIVAKVSDIVSRQLDRLDDIGIPVERKIHVVVEAQNGSFGKHQRTFDHGDMDILGPAMIDPAVGISFPGLMGTKSFDVNKGKIVVGKRDKIMIIPFFGESPAIIPTIIGHELGHETIKSERQPSNIWNEARSDLIAFFITGESKFTLPEPVILREYDRDGHFREVESKVIRDIGENPGVKGFQNVIPSSGQFHINSQVMSHLIFRIAKRTRIENGIELVKFVDSHEIALRSIEDTQMESADFELSFEIVLGAIRNGRAGDMLGCVLERSSEKKSQDDFKTNQDPIQVDGQDIEATRKAIQQVLTDFGRILKSWAQSKDAATARIVDEELSAAGFEIE